MREGRGRTTGLSEGPESVVAKRRDPTIIAVGFRDGPLARMIRCVNEARPRMPADVEWRAQAAARNNAAWCDAVCRAHSMPGAFDADAWTNAHRTPRSYPDAVTLAPSASGEHVLDRIDTASPGCSVKDSFACLDLTGMGFRVLLEADWVYRPQSDPIAAGRLDTRWEPIRDGAGLLAWEAAWSDGQEELGLFPTELLTDHMVTFLGGRLGGRVIAGCVASSSSLVVGVSNLFILDGDLDTAWAGALAAVARHFPGRSVVGYEHGETLAAAVRQGFRPVGQLRVWVQD